MRGIVTPQIEWFWGFWQPSAALDFIGSKANLFPFCDFLGRSQIGFGFSRFSAAFCHERGFSNKLKILSRRLDIFFLKSYNSLSIRYIKFSSLRVAAVVYTL